MCTLPEKESKESDARLVEMADSVQKWSQWIQGKIEGDEAVKLIRRVWKLAEEEGYLSERGKYASDAAYIAAAHHECVSLPNLII